MFSLNDYFFEIVMVLVVAMFIQIVYVLFGKGKSVRWLLLDSHISNKNIDITEDELKNLKKWYIAERGVSILISISVLLARIEMNLLTFLVITGWSFVAYRQYVKEKFENK